MISLKLTLIYYDDGGITVDIDWFCFTLMKLSPTHSQYIIDGGSITSE